MHISTIYQLIYKRLDALTPLPLDCGSLCGKLCCESGGGDETGMYLFPGEEALFRGKEGYRILPSNFIYGNGKRANLLLCTQPCKREERPLSCRIFPLVPYYRRGSGVRIILDPRASICPLTHPEARGCISRLFAAELLLAFRLLSAFTPVQDFLEGLTNILDDYNLLAEDFLQNETGNHHAV